jgi:hypothetical protein
MEKYSVEYWLAHYEFAMGHKPKINIDTSNVDWTRNNIEKVLHNEIPYGMTGTKGAMALIEYLKKYHSDKVQTIAKLMLGYIKSIQSEDKPLITVHNYYQSVITT